MFDRMVFVRQEDALGDNNRGWQVDRINAMRNGVLLGYIRISYVPKKRFRHYYPSVFNFLSQIAGYCGLFPEDSDHVRYQSLNHADLARLLRQAHGYPFPDYSYLSPQGLKQAARAMELRFLQGPLGARFRNFRLRNLDQPIVDYILVEPPHRRAGLGTQLYLEGAKWMAEKNMRLYASDVQSDSAVSAWTSMKRRGMVGIGRITVNDHTYQRQFVKPQIAA